jgi:hypothetical protein
VLDEHHVGPAGSFDRREDAVDRAGLELVVGVHEPDVVALRLGETDVAGRTGPGVLGGRDDPDALVRGGVPLGDGPRAVRGAVVDDDDLEPVSAAHDGVEAAREVCLGLEDGDHNAQRRHALMLALAAHPHCPTNRTAVTSQKMR